MQHPFGYAGREPAHESDHGGLVPDAGEAHTEEMIGHADPGSCQQSLVGASIVPYQPSLQVLGAKGDEALAIDLKGRRQEGGLIEGIAHPGNGKLPGEFDHHLQHLGDEMDVFVTIQMGWAQTMVKYFRELAGQLLSDG